MAFQKIGKITEVASGTSKSYDVGDRVVCVVNINGKFHAIDDLCSHAECNMAGGSIEGNSIECECHGSMFDVTTGQPTNPPAVAPVDVFKVQVNGDDLEVEI
ncbi:MAG: Rieske 2Fe-2S domain-containing protein [Chloroflexi bacterium]|nr:Rieske 2Fe-2S domain-containing protein [Chloroflexota bacterium]